MASKKVVIVGGGSAGWITAAYMNAILNSREHRSVEFIVIESPTLPRISVGEATVPTINRLLQTLRINEKDFMKATDATFKQGIKFVNWFKENDHSYYHTFDRRESQASGHLASKNWLNSDRSIPFAETVSIQPQLCEMNYSPKLPSDGHYQSPLTYAYHMDAEKFANYLCTYSKSQGVKHIQDDVVDVMVTTDQSISAIITKTGLKIEADLYIDCTGFSSLLIGNKLGVGFKDYSQWLICDRAVTMQIPYQDYYPQEIRPYTTSTALSSGWVWDIGLVNRRGIGYVYSGEFISDANAEKELRQYEGEHSSGIACRTVKFSVGRRESFWKSNCVAIGLSAAFVEPLESTGLNMIEFAATTLAEHFPMGDNMKPLADRYNKIMSNRFDDALDFINLHYCLSRRTDTAFWKEVQKSERILKRVQQRIDLWEHKRPSEADFDNHFILFNHTNYEYILYGMNFMETDAIDNGYTSKDNIKDKARNKSKVPQMIVDNIQAARKNLVPHEQWLQEEIGMKKYTNKK